MAVTLATSVVILYYLYVLVKFSPAEPTKIKSEARALFFRERFSHPLMVLEPDSHLLLVSVYLLMEIDTIVSPRPTFLYFICWHYRAWAVMAHTTLQYLPCLWTRDKTVRKTIERKNMLDFGGVENRTQKLITPSQGDITQPDKSPLQYCCEIYCVQY